MKVHSVIHSARSSFPSSYLPSLSRRLRMQQRIFRRSANLSLSLFLSFSRMKIRMLLRSSMQNSCPTEQSGEGMPSGGNRHSAKTILSESVLTTSANSMERPAQAVSARPPHCPPAGTPARPPALSPNRPHATRPPSRRSPRRADDVSACRSPYPIITSFDVPSGGERVWRSGNDGGRGGTKLTEGKDLSNRSVGRPRAIDYRKINYPRSDVGRDQPRRTRTSYGTPQSSSLR